MLGRPRLPLAVLAAVLATLCYGMLASFTKKYMAGVPPLASATGSQMGAALFFLLQATTHLPAQNPFSTVWLAVVVLVVFVRRWCMCCSFASLRALDLHWQWQSLF